MIFPFGDSFHFLTPVLFAHDARVGGSDQSSMVSTGLHVIAKASFHRRGTSLLSPRLIFGVNGSPAPTRSELLFCVGSAREHEGSQGGRPQALVLQS
jgi:hypothetical protein